MKKILIGVLFLIGISFIAQEYQEGIPWGNSYFKPSIEFIYTHSDNIFRIDPSMGNKVDDNIWTIRPQIGLEFPFENSFIGLFVQYEYKDYEDYNLIHHSTWFAHLDSQFKFSNNSVLNIRDHYVQGVQQTEQFDPDMEVYWSMSRFSKNIASLEYSFDVSRLNSLSFHINHTFVNFKGDFDSGILPFFSYDQLSGGILWKYHYAPFASLLFEWEVTKSEPRDDNYFYKIVGLYTTEKEYRENRFSMGWEGNYNRRISGFAKIGYKKMDFEDYFGLSFKDYKGLVADAGLTFKLDKFTDLNTSIFRHANQSSFNVNNYYTATGIDLRLHHQFSRHFFGTLGGKYQKNDYDEPVLNDINGDGIPEVMMFTYLQGQVREDKIWQYLAEIGYHFNPRLSLRFNYFYEKRDSNLSYIDFANILRKPFSYKENRLVFQIQMGW